MPTIKESWSQLTPETSQVMIFDLRNRSSSEVKLRRLMRYRSRQRCCAR
jgi:hypothetical protein